jgi:hypothetical protein
MVDFILAGLSAGLFAFVAFFLISFVILSVITIVFQLSTIVVDHIAKFHKAGFRRQTA